MPDGEVIYSNCEIPEGNSNAALSILLLLLDAATATGNGVWVLWSPFTAGALEVLTTGSPASFSLQIFGSNQQDKPANTFDGNAIGSAVTAAGLTSLSMPTRWIKAKLTALSGGTAPTVTVRLNGATG